MKNIGAIALFYSLLFSAAPTFANGSFKTGNDLYSVCKAEKGSRFYEFEQTTCLEYVTGVFDSFSTSFGVGLMPRTFCSPSSVTVSQLKDIAVRYLEQNPSSRHISAAALVMISFKEAFPCKSEGGGG